MRLRLDAKRNAKVTLSVPPGSELTVDDDVAAQLVAGDPHFKVVDEEPEPAKKPARKRKATTSDG